MQFHEFAAVYPLMEGQEFQDLVEDIRRAGKCNEPITTFEGKILDGRNRSTACAAAGVTPAFREFNGTREEALAFVQSENLYRRHLNSGQRACSAVLYEKLHGEIRKAAKAREKTGKGADGSGGRGKKKTLPKELGRVSTPHAGETDAKLAEIHGTNRQYIADARRELAENPDRFADIHAGKTTLAAAKKAVHVSQSTGMPEWYTPPEYLEATRVVLGKIDLDPASSEIAQQRVKAKAFYTAADDGLSKKWKGRVWMNPPYTAGLVDRFLAKLLVHLDAGEVVAAIVLVNNSTETQWFQQAAAVATAVRFPAGRIKFLDEQGKPGAPLQGQAVLYFGTESKAFISAFRQFGFCAEIRK